MSHATPVNRTSADINQHRLEQLKQLIPEAFAEGQIDFDKLRAALGNVVDDRPDRYTFTWAGKQDAIRLLQMPTTATLVPDPEESVNFDTTKNIFVEGENLETLKLLYKAYFGRVKMIYIDPPYNTGNDFIYTDDYRAPLKAYLRLTGQVDEEGNALTSNLETSGRFHSSWLNMMYPRLFIARQLLRDDGVIFVSIDDNEMHNLRLLMNEIFGEENFQATIIWQKKYAISNDDTGIGNMHDYIVAYSKTGLFERGLFPRTDKQDSRYTNPDNDPRGDWASDNYLSNKSKAERPTMFYPIIHPRTGDEVWPPEHAVWRYSREKHLELERENRLYWGPDLNYDRPRLKRFLSEVRQGLVPSTWWPHEEAGHNDEAKKELARIMEDPDTFSTPKPVRLLERIIQIGAYEDDAIVLDFFAGSSPLAEALLDYNDEQGGSRQFILVQLPEPTGKENYQTISDIGIERIRRVVRRASNNKGHDSGSSQNGEKLGFRVFKLSPSAFRAWSGTDNDTPEEYTQTMQLFTDPITTDADPAAVLWEVTIKEGYPLSSRIRHKQIDSNDVFNVKDEGTGKEFFICLDNQVAADIATNLGLSKSDLLVVRDIALNDTTAANLALQCRLKTL